MGGDKIDSIGNILERVSQENAVLVIGAGHFGLRAARILRAGGKEVLMIDMDSASLAEGILTGAEVFRSGAVEFLSEHFSRLPPGLTIVPAVPVHLAFEWLKNNLSESFVLNKIAVPECVSDNMAHWWNASEGSLLVSYADFMCPDNCPEPEYCTVTGEKRELPLYGLLGRLDVEGFGVLVLRSRQLAPGLGGYSAGDLRALADSVAEGAEEKFLICTSCSCHGIITACEVIPTGTGRPRLI